MDCQLIVRVRIRAGDEEQVMEITGPKVEASLMNLEDAWVFAHLDKAADEFGAVDVVSRQRETLAEMLLHKLDLCLQDAAGLHEPTRCFLARLQHQVRQSSSPSSLGSPKGSSSSSSDSSSMLSSNSVVDKGKSP